MSIPSEVITLIHQGHGFSISSVVNVAGGGNLTFIGIPDAVAVYFHDMTFDSSAGPVFIEFIESPTVSVQGTIASVNNRRRDSENEPRMKVYTGGTISGGTVLASKRIYGDSTGSNAGAGIGIIYGEWDLDPDKTYAIRITNETVPAISINMSVDMSFYEKPIRID